MSPKEPHAGALISAIRDALVAPTLSHAIAGSAYYRDTLQPIAGRVTAVAGLQNLPLVDKQIVLDNLNEITCGGGAEDVQSLTSGTESPLILSRNAAEIAAIDHCRKAIMLYGRASKGHPTRTLELYDVAHGLPASAAPDHIIRIPAPGAGRGAYHWAKEALHATHRSVPSARRITQIAGPSVGIVNLSLYLQSDNVDLASLGIGRLYCSGYYLSRRWRSWLASAWRAEVVDVFSMTEFPNNGAVKCAYCGFMHFTLPTVAPEVVGFDRASLTAVGECGVLVLTSLYPFAQRQPLIRYWTGDIVERGPECLIDPVSFRPRGRLSRAVLDPGNSSRPMLLPLDLIDVLDALPDVFRPADAVAGLFPAFLPQGYRSLLAGVAARVRAVAEEFGHHRICLDVALSFPPDLFPDRAAELARIMKRDLCRASPAFADGLATGRLLFEASFIGPDEWNPQFGMIEI
jgi:hypothetical protein